jgi:hypothetical protein
MRKNVSAKVLRALCVAVGRSSWPTYRATCLLEPYTIYYGPGSNTGVGARNEQDAFPRRSVPISCFQSA